MLGLLQRVQRVAEHRLPSLTRYRQSESLPIQLHRRRIYIVPTGFGIAFSVLLLVMLTGALNYANNAALLLTCLLGAASAASMLVAFRGLNGIRLDSIRAHHAIAGQPLQITLTFVSTRMRSAIRLDLDHNSTAFATDANAATNVTLTVPTLQRGWQPLPRMRVWSTWPIGLFRTWSWLHPDVSVLVWPQPELAGPPPRGVAESAHQMRLHQGDELAALRDYRAGDPQRHIAWKASASHDRLLVKDFEQPQDRPHWQLDWRQLTDMDNESRISRLARWLGEAQSQRRSYSLWLPDKFIPNGNGAQHYAHCMSALAELP